MDLPYCLLCLAHGSHKAHNRKYHEEWFGRGQRLGGKLVYYQEGLLQVKKICQRLIIKIRKHKNAASYSVWRLQYVLWEYVYTPGTVLI